VEKAKFEGKKKREAQREAGRSKIEERTYENKAKKKKMEKGDKEERKC
jgi:hypothetical protein